VEEVEGWRRMRVRRTLHLEELAGGLGVGYGDRYSANPSSTMAALEGRAGLGELIKYVFLAIRIRSF
jgi:hypothetical protein